MEIVEAGGQRKDEISARDGILGVAAVDRVARENGRVAKVLHASTAVRASAVDSADPGDADARADGVLGGGSFDDFAYDLMAGNDILTQGCKLAFDHMQIGAADRAGAHS